MARPPVIARTVASVLASLLVAGGAAAADPAPGTAKVAASAADDAEADALTLANRTDTPDARSSNWRVFVEGAASATQPRAGGRVDGLRLTGDLRYDGLLAPGWRLVFADRLDLTRQWQPAAHAQVNTLKELYVGWQPQPQLTLEAGRINLRNGAATGYNPTDFFKTDALRSITSIDPASLRENRLGVAMLRGQRLWEGGAASVAWAPRLADTASSADFSPDWGATNRTQRWLLSVSQRLGADLSPQWLLYGGDGVPTQLGVNLSRLLNDATVVYAEASTGRSPALLSQLTGAPGDGRLRTRLSTGVTYTTEANLSLTVEYDYNAAGLDRDGWRALAQQPGGLLLQYAALAGRLQDQSYRHGAFFYASWQNALVRRLDLNAMLRLDLERASRLSWIEARYRFDRFDLALQAQQYGGAPDSAFGALPMRRVYQVLARLFF